MANYWDKTLTARISRRRGLIGLGGGALGAAFLAACGGSSNNNSSTTSGSTSAAGASSSSGASSGSTASTGASGASGASGSVDKSGLLAKAADTTAQAKQGGSFPYYVTSEVKTMDPLNNAAVGSGINNQAYAYSRMFQWKPGVLDNPVGGAFVPDAAESYEVSPDGLTITFKMRADVKFDPRPPTNGRLMTANDVKFSWDKFSVNGLTRFDYVNSLNAAGPVKSIDATDDHTVVAKLAFPIANMVSRFAFHRFLSIMPTESDGGFDPKTDQRGSGPWMLRKWEPSVAYTYDRNPTWHLRKGQPFLDTLNLSLISEPAQIRAQLLSGGIWTARTNAGEIDPTDVIAAKKEESKLGMYDDGYPWGGPNHLAFGFKDPSPFQDVRIRRAMSMTLDRDLWIDANYNVSKFEAQGLPMETRWNTHYSADDKTYWLDPKGKDLGEGAAYFQFNVPDATKLMQAAGFNGPMKLNGIMQGNGNNQITSLVGMLTGSKLFDVSIQSLTATDYNHTIYNGSGDFEGLGLAQNMGVRGDIDQYLSTRWSPGGASGTQSMFPKVYDWYQKAQDLVTAQRQELDDKKRLSIILDLEKELAVQMPTVPYPGAANGFSLAWPYLANYGVFRSVYDFEAVYWTRYWYDASKK